MWSLAAAALTNIVNGVVAHRANKVNQRNYEEVRRYNTPVQQMGRFRAAGLNPHLIYSQQNEAEQRPEWKPPTMDFSSVANVPNELSQYQNIKESKSRVDNIAKVNEELTQRIIAETIANKYAEEKERLTVSQLRETIDNIHQATNKVKYEVENILPLEKLKYDLEKGKFEWSQVNDVVNAVFKSEEIDIALKRLGLDAYKTQIELQWQIKLNELLKQVPNLSNLDFTKMFGDMISNSFLQVLLEGIENWNPFTGQYNHKSEHGGSGSFK